MSALPSVIPGVLGLWLRGTVEVVSALAMVTSLALLTSSPQCGQKLWPFSTEAQCRWKRWEMFTSGWHSMKVPYRKGSWWFQELKQSPTPQSYRHTHRPTEVATARAALMFDHSCAMLLTQHQQLHRVRWPHHLLLQHCALTPTQLHRNKDGMYSDHLAQI